MTRGSSALRISPMEVGGSCIVCCGRIAPRWSVHRSVAAVIHAGGTTLAADNPFVEGDVVGVSIDQDQKSVAFFRNGEQIRFVQNNLLAEKEAA